MRAGGKALNPVQRTPKFDADDAGMGKGKVCQELINLLIVIRDVVVPKINHFKLAWRSPVGKGEKHVIIRNKHFGRVLLLIQEYKS